MKLKVGILLFVTGLILALVGYAPFFSPRVSSVALIGIGGLALAAGTFLLLFASARSQDTSDLKDIETIRP